MPVRHGPGNHEMMLVKPNPREDFETLLGPTYYSFDWGPIHCIALDGNKPIPGVKDYKAVHGAVEGSELSWLRADLAAQPPGKPIVVGIHIPVVTTYPERRRESPPDEFERAARACCRGIRPRGARRRTQGVRGSSAGSEGPAAILAGARLRGDPGRGLRGR